MKTVISGKLAYEPKVNEVTKEGKTFKVTSGSMYVYSGTQKNEQGQMLAAKVNFRAFEKNAEEIGKLKKADMFSIIGRMEIGVKALRNTKNEPIIGEDGRNILVEDMMFIVTKVDRENKLGKEMNELLGAYERGQIDKLNIGLEPEKLPEISKAKGKTKEQEIAKEASKEKE